MEKDWNMIEVLRHARHDWLNKIQLIKGNLSLNKVDRAKEIIDEIVVEAQQEAKLSNLNLPQFASLLFTYNWENHSFQLEYEVLDDAIAGRLDDCILSEWTGSFFDCLNSSVKPYHENHLSVSIGHEKEGARFFFDFSGIITDMGSLEQFLKKEYADITVAVQVLAEQELALELFVPFAANGRE
ncbi:sporulation initiation phosphotransferase B [Cytobacillus oceanisediminis]|uniref:Stage 0 sporulation protein B (Sporulation initiation phosphotransferase) n=1 Tax=Cytobacillus oceanisediminis TaxID=665099 RepID=A0A562JNT6_9BACI|nr:sporulation initiation phosphotransferase B [Cytobacillus oceanisediminis]TWH84788.1 stage 0 sporulation protein B (sporulation initiation phosphotransferase) [Cytobacillus oceanisediminis]